MTKIAQLGAIVIFLNTTPAGAQFAPGELDDYSPSEAAPPGEPVETPDQPVVGAPADGAAPVDDQVAQPGGDDHVDALPPPPPPPPPPPSPATQTCPDGSVVLGTEACSASPPPPPPPPPVTNVAYGYVLVSGAGVNEFYYVRQDHFNRLSGANRFEKLRSVLSYDAFGPHPAGSQVRIRHRANYYFFPVCNYQLSWSQRGFASVPEGTSTPRIALKCL